jgi:predicted secreted protein with PEFG-CTERM motif
MEFKRSTTSMAIALMALSLISMTSIQQDAFAQSQGMSITATTEKAGNTITVTGKTVSQFTDVTLSVKSPSGNNLVAAWQVTPDVKGEFSTEFKIGPTWTENGFYTITAKQGSSSLYTLDVLVEVTNGMTIRSTSVTESNLQGIFKPNENNAATDKGIILDKIIVENGSTMFEVTGMTDRVSQDITLKVIAPNGNVVKVAQVSPMLNGEFATGITVGGSLWKQDGLYTVSVQQFDDPKYTASTQVDIKDGVVVPEFGAIAAMILAVAIISIIAVSAKSRLSIMPRY